MNVYAKKSFNVAIIGFGLIGSSIAKALKKFAKNDPKYHYQIMAYGSGLSQSQQKLAQLKQKAIIDQVGAVDYQDLSQADLIIICTPVGTMHQIFSQIKSYAKAEAIITDCGSTKNTVVNSAKKVWQQLPENFVPAHPLAGSEKTGFNTGFADLFVKKLCLLCPHHLTSDLALNKVKNFWQLIGAKIRVLDLNIHDSLLAHTSHLPHLISFCLVNVLLDRDKNILDYASSGFADLSRLASSDPKLWNDILKHNKHELFIALENLQKDLTKAQTYLKNEDEKALMSYFLRAKKARDNYLKSSDHLNIFNTKIDESK